MVITNVAMPRTSRMDTTPVPNWGDWDSSDNTAPQYETNYSQSNVARRDRGFYRSAPAYFGHAFAGPRHGRIETEDGSSIDVTYEGFGGISKLRSGAASDVDEDIKKNAISKVVPATVQIKVLGSGKQSWAGSGFILDPEDAARLLQGSSFPSGTYFISTNHHVANDAKTITIITADGKRTFKAEVVKSRDGNPLMDAVADTALLMIRSDEKLPTAKIGDPADVSQGDTVLTAGYPLALPKISVTKGVVSQPAQITGESLLAIQSDAAINPGNSGGPMFTLGGLVIGTNTYTLRDANDMSFAQPITEQFAVLQKIWSEGSITRGDLGLDVMELKAAERDEAGVPEGVPAALISQVKPDSKAAKLGLKEGDILSSIEVLRDGEVVEIIETDIMYDFQRTFVMNQIYALAPGQNVRVKVYRRDEGGVYKEDVVDLSVAKHELPQEVASPSWGVKAARDSRGDLLLTDVLSGSPAERAGLEGGGNWVIRGLWARDLGGSEPLIVKSAMDLQELFEGLSRRKTTEILLYLEDASDPRKRKAVAIRRDLSGQLLVRADARIIDGALTMAA